MEQIISVICMEYWDVPYNSTSEMNGVRPLAEFGSFANYSSGALGNNLVKIDQFDERLE